MVKYIAKRLLLATVTIFVITFILYLMLDLMPGSPFNDEKLTEAQKAVLYQKYGLDQPFIIKFKKYFVKSSNKTSVSLMVYRSFFVV